LIQDVLPSLQRNAVLLELGCGPGIPSLSAAVCSLSDVGYNNGNNKRQLSVIATDVSPTALSLLRKGWDATQKRLEKRMTKEKKHSEINKDRDNTSLDLLDKENVLAVCSFDVCSSHPLPFPVANNEPHRQQPQCILVACTMLYDSALAYALAKRVHEAIRDFDAWVILGDDVTGFRGSGRSIFWEALKTERHCFNFQSVSTRSTTTCVKNPVMGWHEKETLVWEWNTGLSLQDKFKSNDMETSKTHSIVQYSNDTNRCGSRR
jgi:hypothetical protein